jgi:RNA polymerase sigma-70 factor (ECF subfamily)
MAEARVNDVIQRLLENESAFRQFIRRRVGEATLVDDILQQSLTRAVASAHSLHNEESAVAWFYRILRHAVADHYRALGAEVRRNQVILEESTISGDHQ